MYVRLLVVFIGSGEDVGSLVFALQVIAFGSLKVSRVAMEHDSF